MWGRPWSVSMALVAAAGAACGFSVTGTGETGTGTSSTYSQEPSSSSTGSTADTTVTGSTQTATSEASGSSTAAGTTSAATASGGTTVGDPQDLTCPDPLPDGWIYCQDFENLGDEFAEFDPYFGDGTNFEVDSVVSRSGQRALRMRYTEAGDTWSGEAWVRFGDADNGDGPTFADNESFEEVWVRAHVRTQPSWPGGGFGGIIALDALQGEAGARVASVNVTAEPGGDIAGMDAFTCIIDGDLPCDGEQDWQDQQYIGGGDGTVDIASPGAAVQWHCVALHVALNEPGMANGFASLSVDNTQEVVLEDLDFRGERTEPGLNAVRIQSFWPGGAVGAVERYFDDLVISTGPLACD